MEEKKRQPPRRSAGAGVQSTALAMAQLQEAEATPVFEDIPETEQPDEPAKENGA